MAPEKKRYPRPPIIEAVIELRFDSTLADKEMARARDRFKNQFATIEEMKTIEVFVDGSKVQQKMSAGGYKMTAKNAVDLLMINVNSLNTIRLAPYETWEALIEAAKENFEVFTKLLGRKKVIRVGARFLNRIDIPTAALQGQKVSEFIRLGVSIDPSVTEKIGGFSVALNGQHKETGAMLAIRCGITLPALLEHTSISLDVDAFWDNDVPQRIDEMWDKTDMLRTAKNDVFERAITDKVRALFK